MNAPIRFEEEVTSNAVRSSLAETEPKGLRTYTPTQAVLARSDGLYHWTPEGRRLADFTSGVLVANLGHHPRDWLRRFAEYLQWSPETFAGGVGYASLPPWTAYNALTELEEKASTRLIANLRRWAGGAKMEQVLWSASGSEGIQKALWACLRFQPDRDILLATRYGFHGKKGLAGATSGDEHAPERDPRVRFVSFPRDECRDLSLRDAPFDPTPYRQELERLATEYPGRISCLVTEPYLGGGGSYHPPKDYLRLLQDFCREQGAVFVLDEVQSNFGRTGRMFAFEAYGVEPDIVVLGKGMGNGVPVNAAVGRSDVLGALEFGDGSDTWSAQPLGCAATLATLDIFEETNVLDHARQVSKIIERGLLRTKELEIVTAIRGEGLVWGVDLCDATVANACVRSAYLGDSDGNAIHLLGPLAGTVLRVSPPLTMTFEEAEYWMDAFYRILEGVSVASVCS